MRRRAFLSITATLPLLPEATAATAKEGNEPLFEPVKTISTGAVVSLATHLAPEVPTVFVFYRPGSGMEKAFVQSLQKNAQGRVGFRLIALASGQEPVASQHKVTQTPTALVYDRRGRLLVRSNEADAIQEAVLKAAQVMRLDWAEEGTPLFEEASQAAGGKPLKPGMMRTMSLKPEYLKPFYEMTRKAQFEDGFLPRRTKELIGTYVSGLNHCKFCLAAHADNLRLQGLDLEDVDKVALGQVDTSRLTAKEKGLLAFVRVLTLEPAKTRDPDVEKLRKLGWTDGEIFEACFTTSLFCFVNRMSDAYGLDYARGRWLPPTLRTDHSGTKR